MAEQHRSRDMLKENMYSRKTEQMQFVKSDYEMVFSKAFPLCFRLLVHQFQGRHTKKFLLLYAEAQKLFLLLRKRPTSIRYLFYLVYNTSF